MLIVSAPAIAAGMALVRVGWGGSRRIAMLGWAVALSGLAGLGWEHGAWGIATSCVVASAAALIMVLWAGVRSPRRAWKARRDAPSIMPLRDWRGLGRRLVVFMLVMPVAAGAAFWLAFGTQAVARRAVGMGDADAAVTLLVLFPVAWCGLMAWQMTRAGPRAMVPPPVIAALLGTMLWIAA